MKGKIKTTGQLRDFLADLMLEVKNGAIDLDKASKITKLAGQINESFYTEIKMANVRSEAGEPTTGMGEVPIGSTGK